MICGFLLNPAVYDEIAGKLLEEIRDLEEKRDILKKSLQLQLNKISKSDISDLLELFTALNEAKDGMGDIVKSYLDVIDMYGHPLPISDLHVIGSVASYCTSLSMHFTDCDLRPASLQTLASELKGSNVKTMQLWLDGNPNMGVEGLSSLGQILSNQSCVERLVIGNCNLSSDQLQAFKSSIGNRTNIMNLYLQGNTNMGVEGLSSVGQILSNQCCVKWLGLDNCNLSSDQLLAFKSSLSNTEIEYLFMKEDRIANHEDIVAVANLLPNVTKMLALDRWKIANEDKEMLQNQLNEIGSEKLEIQLNYVTKLMSQRKSADATTNVFSKQLPTTTSKAEFGSPYDSFENTGENVETLQEVGSPRSELLLPEEEAEQTDKEVTEQLAKPTQHTLHQIENVSSQRSGSDILLTWDAVSDRNVLYNIEIFCDDVKLGETHTTKVPQYKMKSPTLGKTYRFQVWAKDARGNSGIKTPSNNVIKLVNVEVAGGCMRLNECKVTFPIGTFNKQTKVWMSVGIDNSLCPEEYIGIAPVFDISADSEFLKDAIVQIQSWCIGLDKDKIDILHFSSKTDWDNINPDRITEDNSIEFRCRKFSRVMAAIRWLIFGTQELLMEHRLYILNKNQFYFAFFTCCETVRSHVISYFQELRGQLAPIPLPQVLLRTGDRVRINLQIDPEQEDLHFNYLNGYTFRVDKTFLGKQRNDYMFRLLPELEEYPRSKIRYEMIKYGNDQEICDRDFDFPLEPVDHQPLTYNFFGDSEQVHIMGRGNVHTSQQGLQQGQNQLLFTIAVLLLLVAIFLAFLVGWPDSTM
uniref:uncharacterized protein LOC120334961 n=1 Tax=Styela clava TaxID=7725 RepID=UPI00193ADA1D|nr:uncharacterized protein LOC120334961 [Styela clava]